MPGYIALMNFTQQGIAGAKESPARIEQLKGLAQKMGIRIVGIWWTLGQYDGVMVIDASDDQAVGAFMLAFGMAGSGRSQTMRAFGEEEIAQVLGRLP